MVQTVNVCYTRAMKKLLHTSNALLLHKQTVACVCTHNNFEWPTWIFSTSIIA